MDIQRVFSEFCRQLSLREKFLSEDNIRFYWFASMLKEDSDLDNYSLEEPYTTEEMDGHKELDLMYENGEEIWAIEIKFHRNKNKEEIYALPMGAGEIFDDLQRLPLWKKTTDKFIRYFFLYVTDVEMHNYLSFSSTNRRNEMYRQTLRGFYTASIGKVPTCIFKGMESGGDTPKTFLEHTCKSYNTQVPSLLQFDNLHLIRKDEFDCKSPSLQTARCYVRLYEIKQ